MIKTLVIHPKDHSTDFLKPIYETLENKTVITGGLGVFDVDELIKSHDRVIMMGHGYPGGLFSCGQFLHSPGCVIDNHSSELMKDKPDNIYIWCNADKYVDPHYLNGFYSGMFISEVGEASYCGIKNPTQQQVTESNDMFASILSKYINENTEVIHQNVTKEYGEYAKTSPIAEYNNNRLYKRINDVLPESVSNT